MGLLDDYKRCVETPLVKSYEDRLNAYSTALTEARAEIETKTQAIADMARQIYEMRSKHDTLRARVREVVGPFADAASDLDDTDKDSTDIWEAPCAMQVNVGHLRAARQLNEDLK